MTAEALCSRVTDFGFKLLEHEFALDARHHAVNRISSTMKEVIWARNGTGGLMVSNPFRIDDYLSLLSGKEYSYLMLDGALVQVAYTMSGSSIERHRLSLFPCPFPIVPSELLRYEGGLLEYISENYVENIHQNIVMRSPIRFDFAPEAVSSYHPASHVTINEPSCRIPARAPLGFDTFMRFLLENFYFDACANNSIMSSLRKSREKECLSVHDRKRAIFTWSVV